MPRRVPLATLAFVYWFHRPDGAIDVVLLVQAIQEVAEKDPAALKSIAAALPPDGSEIPNGSSRALRATQFEQVVARFSDFVQERIDEELIHRRADEDPKRVAERVAEDVVLLARMNWLGVLDAALATTLVAVEIKRREKDTLRGERREIKARHADRITLRLFSGVSMGETKLRQTRAFLRTADVQGREGTRAGDSSGRLKTWLSAEMRKLDGFSGKALIRFAQGGGVDEEADRFDRIEELEQVLRDAADELAEMRRTLRKRRRREINGPVQRDDRIAHRDLLEADPQSLEWGPLSAEDIAADVIRQRRRKGHATPAAALTSPSPTPTPRPGSARRAARGLPRKRRGEGARRSV